ncbi:hypothetical protein Tco_0933920 [Tanacetum coccineum]
MVVQNQAELGEDEAIHKELGDSLVRAATTASSLEAEQDSGNINKTQSKATPTESNSGGGPKCQEAIGDTTAHTRFESVLDLEKTKTTQQNEISSLKRRVKKLENKANSRTHKLKRLYKVGLTARVESSDNEESLGEDASKQGRIDAIDIDEEITLVIVAEQEVVANKENDKVNVVEEVVEVINTAKLIFDVAQVSAASDKVSTASVATTGKSPSQDKGKGILVEEPVKSMKKKDQISLDEETALNLQDDIHAKIDADHQLAERMQAQEQEELSIEEKATLFQQLLEKRRKHFAAKKAEEKRNKPPTQAQ